MLNGLSVVCLLALLCPHPAQPRKETCRCPSPSSTNRTTVVRVLVRHHRLLLAPNYSNYAPLPPLPSCFLLFLSFSCFAPRQDK
jgi:hypothetical protein